MCARTCKRSDSARPTNPTNPTPVLPVPPPSDPCPTPVLPPSYPSYLIPQPPTYLIHRTSYFLTSHHILPPATSFTSYHLLPSPTISSTFLPTPIAYRLPPTSDLLYFVHVTSPPTSYIPPPTSYPLPPTFSTILLRARVPLGRWTTFESAVSTEAIERVTYSRLGWG